MNYKLGRGGLKAILDKATDMYKGSLFNYVDQNLPIIDPRFLVVKEFLYCYKWKSA